ncbi:hypothetical protein NBT05_11045 [Aquimarina sp. ERC-38]|uniref:hypothetical protein n=1 Tax=Aquimarina sp. ERC-38 TaxID=2949996 RepID=UPI00224788BD|nr:hypothetical protein [Aquimarina sp. ERC-38]UZO79496.1 hypothetical protein NBT05_11045 [Aquimarina sp. ERC-38]
MKITNKLIATTMAALGLLGATSCSGDDDGAPTAQLTMKVVGLQELTNGARYEGWIIVNGEPVSTGSFTSTSPDQTFTVNAAQLEEATEFVLSIESDNDPAPSDSKLLSGRFNDAKTARVGITEVVGNLDAVSGQFVLASPTDNSVNPMNNDENGIWFMNPNNGSPTAGLNLPELQQGWQYEGWVEFEGNLVSTGKFNSVSGSDLASPFSGNDPAPPFPGEDFLNSAPAGLTFPDDGDVRGKRVFISIEPNPDYDQAGAFFVRPLTGMAEQQLAPNTTDLDQTASDPFGTVTRP